MAKIRKKDNVMIIAGKDKGKQGEVLKVFYKLNNFSKKKVAVKALVQGINLSKKHKKGDPSKNSPGSIISKEMPIAISNIALIDPTTNKVSKVGFKLLDSGSSNNIPQKQKKVRYFKASGEVVDV